MNRYIVTLKSVHTGATRRVTVAANGIIDARIKADAQRCKGETVVTAVPYEAAYKIVVA